jgi:hypothetical protein
MRRVCLWLIGGVAGSLLFWTVQVAAGSGTITAYIGEQVVAAGGYSPTSAPFIGWAVHLGVSLSYAGLVAILAWLLRSASGSTRFALGLAATLALGWVTALIAPPAISVTVGVLAGQGWPHDIFPLNTDLSLPLWNHLAFFTLNWLVQVVAMRVR